MPGVGRTPVPESASDSASAELVGVARELRLRRELLSLSQVALAELSGVSRGTINRVERGRRVPSVRTYARLRAALGLEAPPASLISQRHAARLEEDRVAALSAALLVTREAPLADLRS